MPARAAPGLVAVRAVPLPCRSSGAAAGSRLGWSVWWDGMDGSLMSHWAIRPPPSCLVRPAPYSLRSQEESGKEGKPAGVRIRPFQRQLLTWLSVVRLGCEKFMCEKQQALVAIPLPMNEGRDRFIALNSPN